MIVTIRGIAWNWLCQPLSAGFHRPYVLVLVLIVYLGLGASASAQRAPFPIPDPDPEVERKSFIVADGFEVNLFAADPILAKPIQINFDPQGRLWVASSEVYPQILPGQVANDKVLVLEDKDGDGKAEKTTVFADGLLIPTGVAPGDGGVYVANSTELLHFKDTDGDGKADHSRVMLSGFGTEDTHHILHTLRWGFDGQLYFNQSIYIHSHIETPRGVRRLGGGGIWEYRPETGELEVFIRGLVNPWGHHFDRWGQSFATDGAGGEGINYCLPGAYYFTAPDAVRILPGLNPGSPKDCGLEVVSGRHLPESWQGSLITNDFRGNRVCRYVVSDDGAGFAAREQPELIKTTHMAFRPIDVKLGPDGAIYIADWYNPIIQHGEVDFRDLRRDHTRGRIWRVTAKGRPLVERPKLVGASVPELLGHLTDPEGWTREQAKRVLKERGAKEVLPALANWVKGIDEPPDSAIDGIGIIRHKEVIAGKEVFRRRLALKGLDPKDPDFEHQRLEALWTYQSLDVVEPALLAAVLKSPDARARAAAVRVLRHWHDRLDDPVALLRDRVVDENPRVRLEAVRALAQIPTSQSAEVAMRALDRPVDRFLDYALWLTARDLKSSWLPAVTADRLDALGTPAHLVFALQSVATPEVVEPLLRLMSSGSVPPAQEQSALTLIATLGQPRDLALIFAIIVQKDNRPASSKALLLDGLVKAARQRNVRPEVHLLQLAPLIEGPDEALRIAAARAAGVWKATNLVSRLEVAVNDPNASAGTRDAAVDSLLQIGGPAADLSLERLAEHSPVRLGRLAAMRALATRDPGKASRRVVAWLETSKDPAEAEAAVTQFSGVKNGARALSVALKDAKLPTDAARLALRAASAAKPEEPLLIEAIRKAGRLDVARTFTAEEKVAILADVASQGDAARGESIYRAKSNQCQVCHAIAGAGGQVGPSLESIGASAPGDYLLDSLLEPGKAIKENYHSLVVVTTDGQVLTGIKVRQNDRELVLRDATDHERAIPLASIEEQKTGGSLMPSELVNPLTRSELVDLVRFLSELGKIGPYSISKDRVFRRWEVLEPDGKAYTELRRWGLQSAANPNPALTWTPSYSKVSGDLPLSELPLIRLDALPGSGAEVGATGFAHAQVSVSTPGAVKLAWNTAKGLRIWVDGTPAESKDNAIVLDLASGLHTITVAVEKSLRKEPLRCTLEDVPGSPARAQVVLGSKAR